MKEPLFKKQRRLNELFNLEKAYNIHEEMTPQQILMWANSLLKPSSLQIRPGEKVYRLELQNDFMSLITRQNKNGSNRNLLNQQVRKQVAEEEDLILDDEPVPATADALATGKPKAKKAKKQLNTARLDTGINTDDE